MQTMNKSKVISIVVVLTKPTNETDYERALDSLTCYSKSHGYKFILAHDEDYMHVCKQNDKFFRRHCVVAQHLNNCDYLLFLDADMGVVNPERRIEEFIDERFDVTFYDRFFNAEIATGAYLLKNTPNAMEFIQGFANYESQLPNSYHGTDNGAIHAYIMSKIFPDRSDEYKICLKMYNVSRSYSDLSTYETCIRSMMGIGEEFGKYRVLRKTRGWARDNWLTNSLWNPETDFMIHGWKVSKYSKYATGDLPLKMTINKGYTWYDPIVGDFDFDKCSPGNYSWNHDPNLIAPASAIRKHLAAYKLEIQLENYKYLAKIVNVKK